ncbi:uncharacterized protein LOC110925357 [Helianthus annuus]|uniref:uncharacterized protein LOC110925357 n=1 Tax=Helianthus annuus TaxID=4232 RepID=UPI001652F5D1|nr:uncharacterized protein LOC110925357 [Helianthus annuus]
MNTTPILRKTPPKLSTGKSKLLGRQRITSPIPMVDLTTDAALDVDPYKGVSPDYLDHGDQCITCQVCNAKFWEVETARGRTNNRKTSYFLCCGYAKVELPDYKDAHPNYQKLFTSLDNESKHFLKNIRRYNSMFAFTSMGGKVDPTVNRGNGPFCYRISGENYHSIGSLLPENGNKPKFCQLYIYDTENEVSNRDSIFSRSKESDTSSSASVDRHLIQHIKSVLDSDNVLVKVYRMVRDCFHDDPQLTLKVRLIGRRDKDGRMYNLPTCGEVAALIVGDVENAFENRDIVVETKSGTLQRISELHPSYLALQYPILFPYGDDGYRVDIPHRGVVDVTNKKRPNFIYTIEFQKRGLPHAHLCLFMEPEAKIPTVDQVDPFICAEIPNRDDDPELYTLVKDFMIHGPCGNANMSCPCMVDKQCSKGFPKRFQDTTTIDANGFPLYRRRDDGRTVVKNRIELDNRSVVPYNKKLLKKYQAHINVEWCNQAGSIKYLFKYINKGPDRATVAVLHSDNHNEQHEKDEIKEYYDCRYISACEASWRIFSYDVNYRYPSVMRLPFHLPGLQPVVFGADEDINYVLNRPSVKCSMFLSWMERNKDPDDHLARTLTYVQFPTWYVWKTENRCWQPRKKGNTIGRIHNVAPSLGEAYFLRILLNKVKGPKSYDDIKTVNGHVHDTFRDACFALGLLDDDKEYIEAIKEANETATASYVRNLFGMMLLSNTMSRPEIVWESTWKYMTDDFIYRYSKLHRVEGLSIPDDELKNYALLEIEKFLGMNSSSLRNFSTMPFPDSSSLSDLDNRLINEERTYDVLSLAEEYVNLFNMLTEEQRSVFEEIMKSVDGNTGGMFFVYGYGGTGKTFLWKTLSAALRSKREIVLNVASSGIASLLLTGGRTAHSRFRIPLNLNEDSVCHIKADSDVAKLLHQTKLIIWDEAPMVHKHAFEALNRTMNDIFNFDTSRNSETSFGGKVIVFGGDFRQVLPVVRNGGRQETVNASLSSSYLWSKCKVLTLSRNMRLTVGRSPSEIEEINSFAKWLLDIGEGNVGGPNDGEATIEVPSNLIINDTSDPISSLIEFVYPSILDNFNSPNYFSDRAILAPKNEVVNEINDRLLALFPGEEREYLSSDRLCATENVMLKVGVPVMLLRNIDQKNGLCNGTRLKVTKLYNRLIEAEIISGANIGTRTYIPRITLVPSDKKIPFSFQRRQFPVVVCFAMTINKSQGQSLSRVGLYLRQPVFTHGQLYVALSRVRTRDGVKMLILDKDGKPTNKTTNVVYKEIFNDL